MRAHLKACIWQLGLKYTVGADVRVTESKERQGGRHADGGWRGGWRDGWRDRGMEGWWDGGEEGWGDGWMEGWMDGGVEGWGVSISFSFNPFFPF